MLAKAPTSLLPLLTRTEQLAVTIIHSTDGEWERETTERPFRSPHHTTSRVVLIGGGSKPEPGEISLTQLGVLFLDELPEYPRATLETLRQPLEDHTISIARVGDRITYPADFMLVATMNPCPCGYYGDPDRECSCSSTQIMAYQKRLSGPLLDRIEPILTVSKVDYAHLMTTSPLNKKQHPTVSEYIMSARICQKLRYNSSNIHNASLSSADIKKQLQLSPEARKLLLSASQRLALTAAVISR